MTTPPFRTERMAWSAVCAHPTHSKVTSARFGPKSSATRSSRHPSRGLNVFLIPHRRGSRAAGRSGRRSKSDGLPSTRPLAPPVPDRPAPSTSTSSPETLPARPTAWIATAAGSTSAPTSGVKPAGSFTSAVPGSRELLRSSSAPGTQSYFEILTDVIAFLHDTARHSPQNKLGRSRRPSHPDGRRARWRRSPQPRGELVALDNRIGGVRMFAVIDVDVGPADSDRQCGARRRIR